MQADLPKHLQYDPDKVVITITKPNGEVVVLDEVAFEVQYNIAIPKKEQTSSEVV